MKPAAARTLSHWYDGESERNRPVVSSTYADSIITAAVHPMISMMILTRTLPLCGVFRSTTSARPSAAHHRQTGRRVVPRVLQLRCSDGVSGPGEVSSARRTLVVEPARLFGRLGIWWRVSLAEGEGVGVWPLASQQLQAADRFLDAR